jgi:hypothetical protein
MAQATTRRTTVEITDATAQALWAAMHEDDDLASSYADLAVVAALSRYISDRLDDGLSEDARAKLYHNHGEARAAAMLREREMAKRFAAYCEPPF